MGDERAEAHRRERLQVGRLHLQDAEYTYADEDNQLHDVHDRDHLQRLGLPAVVGGGEHHRRGHHHEHHAELGKEVVLDRECKDDGVERAGQRVADPEEPAGEEGDRIGQRAAHERVAAPRNRNGGAQFAVAEGRKERDPPHGQIRHDAERPGEFGHFAGEGKHARAHHGANADHHGHEEADVALKACLLGHEILGVGWEEGPASRAYS